MKLTGWPIKVSKFGGSRTLADRHYDHRRPVGIMRGGQFHLHGDGQLKRQHHIRGERDVERRPDDAREHRRLLRAPDDLAGRRRPDGDGASLLHVQRRDQDGLEDRGDLRLHASPPPSDLLGGRQLRRRRPVWPRGPCRHRRVLRGADPSLGMLEREGAKGKRRRF